MTEPAPAAADPRALVRLATWLSPAFPVGGFAYSHGLEAAFEGGLARGATAVRDWIATLLESGSGWNDLVLFAEAFRAGEAADRLAAVTELAEALAGSAERRLETLALGEAFAKAVGPWETVPSAPYPVAVGLAARRSGLPLEAALAAYAQGFAANLLGAATRLAPLGQSEAMRAARELEPAILAAAGRAARSTPDDLGSAAILSDIAAMRHETLRTRLFRS
ncbi:urease accessory protein UreF [Aureimonas endophytica]|uniref:Urease accessory protein UreF n=1 Tax=Aureimonas endophytica TaxID=2027858 RepID=A0A917ED20_9HYPH|nr:urease accessory protein UreF [Aureimonas endophytica]GGE20630.1 urease accessory protein UreF [Aureimonas endophytica]